MSEPAAPPQPVAPDAPTQTLPPPTALRGRGDRPDRPAEEVVEAAGRGSGTTATERQSALDWFLSTDEGDSTKVIEINVGTDQTEKWIKWTIKPVDADELRRIQRVTTARRGKEDVAADMASLRVVVAGTADPDLGALARQQGIADPAMALRMRFARKPGLTGQIANEIMALSGFDDEDIREAAAAGN